jgi:hypothetical protein
LNKLPGVSGTLYITITNDINHNFAFIPELDIGIREDTNTGIFIYNLFTKGTDKIHCRYEAPREEPREAHGYLALDYDGYMVALSVNSNLVILWENVKVSQIQHQERGGWERERMEG